MSIQVALHHKTEYHYDQPVTLLPQVVRLRPAPHCRTPIVSYSLKVEPREQFLNWHQDPYSNHIARFVFPKPARKFTVEVDLVAEMICINPFDFFLEDSATAFPFNYEKSLAVELHPYLEIKEAGPELESYLKPFRARKEQTIDFLVGLNRTLQQDICYVIRMEPGIQTCAETLTRRCGSCRDSAWLLVQICRHLGLAARFVSGYLIQLVADVKALDGPSGPEKDFTDLHAWTEVYLPGAGWVGLDPTSGLLAGEGHIPLACTADPENAAPITGSFSWNKKSEHDELGTDFHFAMSVRRIVEKPRVTKPYTDEQWACIDKAGHAIDRVLQLGDVRLTMGGEPTFVATDDFEGAEWTTAALGPTKQRRADLLLRRLRDKFAVGGLLHFGQGKWYPGESLPRWAYGCWWRRDGEALWSDPSLIGEEGKNYGYNAEDAGLFIRDLARRLGVSVDHAIRGFEDVWYYLWRERQLPTNVDPLDSRLDDPEERARLARVFDQGLGAVVGHALPLRKQWIDGVYRWVSGPWFLRRERLFLIPGDSPMGYRLPLDSLPWQPPNKRQESQPLDAWLDHPPLPSKAEWNQRYQHIPRPTDATFAQDDVVRTALCVEPRQGRLYIFMPPQSRAEDYLELVTAIEATAKALQYPVQLEGYPPPYDPRLVHFKITPDPGVLEVNIQPSSSWDEMSKITTTLYDEAHQVRLGTEKFMLDGRHVGTGGGNHIVLGGPTPADSPFLRRPDLLRSLVAYWHNHPSLSYLFSGLFVGPTSQAPRVDEARNDSVFELETAFKEIPESGPVPPWLVDRIFRHLLVDVTGNTHRAEWCIDKLYSPDSSHGRMGLVEFRAFEMPPHARMSLVQQLLVRGLVARFWDAPYRAPLARWGTELHDRFMLPHFVSQDFNDVLEEMKGHGFEMRPEWFAPHFEFRFPQFGKVARHGIELEIRQAIEPWHVLGEEAGAGGTVRFVDSSVERVQVLVRGLIGGRHVITCNGRKTPLHPTGTNGEYVAGVRYRAWQPPSCLHPTIGIHTPLVFDILDTWMERSVGGCMYHVAHPAGRNFETFPVNANEAEGRRVARFFALGHTPGPMPLPVDEVSREFPFTLDLRRNPPRLPQVAPRPEPFTQRFSIRMKGKSNGELAHEELVGSSTT
jgi:uncharacterized protein (DUF2126 family)/transglutaminase-like putative cysteine protease